jgi:excisionase family DNA binding protein
MEKYLSISTLRKGEAMDEGRILEQLDRIEKATLLAAKQLLTVNDLSQLYGMKRSFLYKLTANKEVPFYRRAKTIYFKRDEIESWLTTYRSATKKELEQEAINHQIRKENNL